MSSLIAILSRRVARSRNWSAFAMGSFWARKCSISDLSFSTVLPPPTQRHSYLTSPGSGPISPRSIEELWRSRRRWALDRGWCIQMPAQQRQKPKSHLKDLANFRASLWKALAGNAESLSGPQVVRALREISDDIYCAGVDKAYVSTKVRDPQNLADAWDLTWLTALNVNLLHLRRGKQRRRLGR